MPSTLKRFKHLGHLPGSCDPWLWRCEFEPQAGWRDYIKNKIFKRGGGGGEGFSNTWSTSILLDWSQNTHKDFIGPSAHLANTHWLKDCLHGSSFIFNTINPGDISSAVRHIFLKESKKGKILDSFYFPHSPPPCWPLNEAWLPLPSILAHQ